MLGRRIGDLPPSLLPVPRFIGYCKPSTMRRAATQIHFRYQTNLAYRAGFTLVELLVVIGIIGGLVAILLPAIAHSRRTANQVQCLAKLQQIGMASILHANDHRGYFPFAGHINDNTIPCTPSGFSDSEQRKYSYFSQAGVFRPMPYPGAVAKYLGYNVSTDSQAALLADLQSPTGVAKFFTCPTQDPMQLGGTTVGGGIGYWYFPKLVMGYVFNEGLLGFPSPNNARRLGHIVRVKYASQVLVLGDGKPNGFSAQLWWTNADTNISLADAFNQNGTAGERMNFDMKRHEGKMNVLFVDGHAATLFISKNGTKASSDLAPALLQPPK